MIRELFITWSWVIVYSMTLWIWEVHSPQKQLDYAVELSKEWLTPVVRFFFAVIVLWVYTDLCKLLNFTVVEDVISTIRILSLPFWLRMIICYVLADLTFYICHWAMHKYNFFWLTHKYHHSSDNLWLLSGYRVSILSMFIIQLGYTWFILLEIPSQYGVLLLFHSIWVHLNLENYGWMKVIEWIFVTPRFHRVHHCYAPELQGKNLGGMFTFFDRIFGTYVNPTNLNLEEEKIGLGTDERITARMMIGF